MRRWTAAWCLFLVSAVFLQADDWYVGPGGTDGAPPNGTAPGTPFQHIGYAIVAASDGDTLHVAAGTYNESDLLVDKSLVIQGAGAGSTTVDAGYGGVVFFLYGVGKTIELQDLSIVNGIGRDGGGVLCVAATGTIRRCVLTGNISGAFGGGARNQYGDLRLTRCVVYDNLAKQAGGGAYGCRLDNSLLVYNTATNGGGAASCTLNNCTLSTNTAAIAGGTLDCKAYNSIVYFNGAGEAASGDYKNTEFADSCAFPLPAGSGNIDSDPLFVDTAADFREFITSPCINRGNPDYVVGSEDLYGANRLYDGLPDMGASEFTSFFVPARIPFLTPAHDFGVVQVGCSSTQTIWALNKGNSILTVTGFTPPEGFTASIADPTVNPGESNAVQVVFAPVRDGSYTGLLLLLSDQTWGAATSRLTGVGMPAPAIAAQPASITASAVAGSNPSGVVVQVSNTATSTMAFSVASDQAWVLVSPAGGASSGAPVPIQVDFNAGALPAGVYAATVTVSAASATNSPVAIPVSLTLAASPVLELSAASFVADCPAGANATSRVFQVRNGVTGSLPFTITTDDGEWEPLSPAGRSWLKATPASGVSTGDWVSVTVSFDAAGLPNGVYTGVVRVASAGASGSPGSVAVRLTVGLPFIEVNANAADWFVSAAGSDTTGDGSAGNPYATIAKAVGAASGGQIIQVATGLYAQAGIAIRKSVTIRGAGWNSTILQPPATVDQEWESRIFYVDGLAVNAAFENMWLRNGRAHDGAAVLAVGATVTVSRCRMSGNRADLDGGGAVRNLNGAVTLKQCILDRNSSTTEGGAAHGCALDNCLVVYNTAQSGGGVFGGRLSTGTAAYNEGGGVKGGAVSNSIVIFNTGGNLAESTAVYTMSDSAAPGEGNLAADPLFEEGTNGNFHLDLVSPAINSEAASAGQPILDLYGRPRLVGMLLDLGPLEKQYVVPVKRMRLAGNLAFGETGVGFSADRTLWVLNTGNTNLAVSGISAPEAFTAAPQTFVVAAGASNAVTVTFAPPAEGAYGGPVIVDSDALNSPAATNASGTGVYPPSTLGADPLIIAVVTVEGANASNVTMTVSNRTSPESMDFTVTSGSGWMTPVPASGTSTGNAVAVTLVFNTGSLLYGSYTGMLTVASTAATNAPLTAEVRLTVKPGRIPARPVPRIPVQDAQVAMTNALSFAWSLAARAEQYHVWIGTNGFFFTNAWTAGESATNVTVTAPFRIGSYMWMVAGSNWLGYGPWSTTVTFKVIRIVSPTGGVILPPGTTPEFRWTETPGATQYELQAQRYDKTFASWFAYLSQSAATPAGVWTPAGAFPKGSYRWRLRERVDGAWAAWDPWSYFQIALPLHPTPVAPIGIGYLWKNVRFSWSGVPTATAYQLEILAGGALYYIGPWQSGLNADVRLAATPAIYKWHVRARNGAGAGAWSPLAKLVRLNLAAPSGMTPGADQILPYGSLATFAWNTVPGANRFQIYLWYGADPLAEYKLYGADNRTYTGSLPLGVGAYTWVVRAGNADGWGPWSLPATFSVQ